MPFRKRLFHLRVDDCEDLGQDGAWPLEAANHLQVEASLALLPNEGEKSEELSFQLRGFWCWAGVGNEGNSKIRLIVASPEPGCGHSINLVGIRGPPHEVVG
jgi:hypothetical protein